MNDNIIKPEIGYIDNIISKFVYETIDFWYNIGFTPNMLTTLGLVSSILCVYFFWKKNSILAIIFLLLRCYFDYADGMLARKYKQVSKFGDYYDHITDIFGFAIPIIIVLLCNKNKSKWIYLVILLIFMYFTSVQIGLQEIAHEEKTGENNTSLNLSKKLAKWSIIPNKILKYVDNGTMYVILTVIIILMCNNK